MIEYLKSNEVFELLRYNAKNVKLNPKVIPIY